MLWHVPGGEGLIHSHDTEGFIGVMKRYIGFDRTMQLSNIIPVLDVGYLYKWLRALTISLPLIKVRE